jgi:tetratricopeptide (TPR) repeat protein
MLERGLEVGVQLLELFAVLAGLVLVALLVGRLLISLWQVTVGGAIAVLPFEGSEKAAMVSQLLPQRWVSIERELRRLVEQVREERPGELVAHPAVEVQDGSKQDGPKTDAAAAQDEKRDTEEPLERAGDQASGERAAARLGAAPRVRPVEVPNETQFLSMREEPIERALPPIALGGVSVSPNVVLDILRRIGAAAARRTVQGTVHELGETIRMSVSLKLGRGARSPLEVVAEAKNGLQLLGAVDDLAFAAVKDRAGMSIPAPRWQAYKLSLEAYLHHLRFERTGLYEEREQAIVLYGKAIESDPDDPVANYNRGTLLYARYLEPDTKQAVSHFEKAAETGEGAWRALALAGLAMSYCQMVHRYDYPSVPWSGLAQEASQRALELEPDLEEVACAHAFALQTAGRYREAVDEYERTTTLPGDTREEYRLRSFARNNAGWIKMQIFDDSSGAAAEFDSALELWPYNKMSYANLAELRRRHSDLDSAISLYEKALHLDSHYVNGANELGMVYIEKAHEDLLGRDRWLEEALSWHRRALSFITTDATQQEASLRRRFAKRVEELDFAALAESVRKGEVHP